MNFVIGKSKILFLLRNGNFVIGKSKILFLLRNLNFVIGKSKILFLLRNTYFIIGTSLINPRPKDPRDAIDFAMHVALAKHSPSAFVKDICSNDSK